MNANRLARRTVVPAVCVLGAALVAPAAEAASTYSGRNVNVWLTGGEATTLIQCLVDAQDGVVNTQLQACHRAARTGDSLRLANTTVWVSSPPATPVLHWARATIVISGPVAVAINQRVTDAQDGVINDQTNANTQIATSGNSLRLSRVSVVVNG